MSPVLTRRNGESTSFFLKALRGRILSVLGSSSEKAIYQERLAELSVILNIKMSPQPTPFDTEILTSPSFNNLYVYVQMMSI